jgi:molybdate transport system substrate-binding protein|tara:strand:- start:2547 stop:3311 length:765 start_codon:yes stop_codon:yes gene_type:complete
MVLMSDLGHSMSDMRVKLIMIFAVLCMLITPLSQAEPARLTIACAANFSATMNKLVELYVTQSQQKLDIRVSVGSSGALASQIHHGAPYDLFFSADTDFIDQLLKAGKGRERHTYAVGDIVLYSLQQRDGVLSDWLTKIPAATVAIANPQLAPYGRAAQSILEHQGLTPRKQVQGTSVLHAFQFVETGHAEYGFIARSLLQREVKGSWHAIPPDWYEPISQDAMLITNSSHARAFFDFIKSEQAQLLIRASGYR